MFLRAGDHVSYRASIRKSLFFSSHSHAESRPLVARPNSGTCRASRGVAGCCGATPPDYLRSTVKIVKLEAVQSAQVCCCRPLLSVMRHALHILLLLLGTLARLIWSSLLSMKPRIEKSQSVPRAARRVSSENRFGVLPSLEFVGTSSARVGTDWQSR